MQLKRLSLSIGALLLSLSLSSCLVWPRLGPDWDLVVENRANPNFRVFDTAFETCSGGLQGKITLPKVNLIQESALVLPDSEYQESFIHQSKAGDPITFGAWCYGERGAELGYIKRQTQISHYYTLTNGSVLNVYPPFVEPSAICITPTESRGDKLPCLFGLSFDQ